MSQTLQGTIIGDGNIYSSPTTKLDSALSTESTNAVQNNVITAAINAVTPYNTAAAHNAFCRGKDLTSYEASGEMSKAIAAATFNDIFPGDYIIKSVTIDGTTYSNIKWIIMDLDYHYNRGYGSWTDSEGKTTANYAVHHVLLMPEHYLFTSYMNSDNTTEGGYQGSYMFKTVIPKINTGVLAAFGKTHVLMHDELLTNKMNANLASSCYSGWKGATYWDWSGTDGKTDGSYPWRHDIQCNIPNQAMMYGHAPFASSGYDTGDCTKQLAYFRLGQNFDKNYWSWLRDVSSMSDFACVGSSGDASYYDASYVGGVRPYFLYH